MSQVINQTCRVIAFTGLLFSHLVLGKAVDRPKNVSVKDLLHKLSRARLIEILGSEHLQDSLSAPTGDPSNDWLEQPMRSGSENKQPIDKKELLFAPVQFEGVPALIEAVMLNDTTTIFHVYLPYIGRPATRLKFPFETTNFVRGTSEDYYQIERKIEDELGIPTVLTGANFEYLNGNTQSIFGVFEDKEIRITIIPQVGQ